MIRFAIMSFILGFTLNKLYFKDKSLSQSIKIGSITAIILIIIKTLVLM